MKILKLLATLVTGFVLLSATPVTATPAASDIGKELVCQCGCNSILVNCTHSECHSRSSMLTSIEEQLSAGKSGEQIIASVVVIYGEKVLASPPKKGFNLVAWLLPFSAIVAGAVAIALALRVWVGRGRYHNAETESLPGEDNKALQQRLESELKEFPEGGFR